MRDDGESNVLKKISVEHLRLGMHVHELCGSWMDHPFWRSKFVISDVNDLNGIRESGITELWIDVAKGLDVAVIEVRQTQMQPSPREEPPKRVSMAEETARAAKICAKAKDAVASMYQEVRMGKTFDSEVAGGLVQEISSSVMRNPGALISLARLKTADDYTYMHSVAVCALMVALARQLNLDAKLTRELGMAGLLHDMGKAFTPPEILNKPGKLTDEEFTIMRQHPVEGHKVLLEGGAVGEIPLDVSLHHHEKMDGNGYPERLASEKISLYAKMGAVCDVYDAITSNRPYHAGWDPAEAIRRMTEWCKGHFDERIFKSFVKIIGIYPVGSLVRLESGRLAVVMEQSEKSLLTPKVKVFYSTRLKTYIMPEILALSQAGSREKIAGCEDAATWGIKNLEQFLVQ